MRPTQTPRNEWVILAPGPSLALVEPGDLPPAAPVVAINNAGQSNLPWTFWCCQDNPRNFPDAIKHVTESGRINSCLVWCSHSHTDDWRALGFRTWPHAPNFTKFKEEHPWRVPKDLPIPMGLTITTAITRCIVLGAKVIWCYGVDMTGKSYSHGEDFQNRHDAAWGNRWRKERGTFTNFVDACRSADIQVIWGEQVRTSRTSLD